MASAQQCGSGVEAQVAHIMSIEAGGPDTAANGIPLSGTVHWMFDRGLISLRTAAIFYGRGRSTMWRCD